MYHKRKIRAYIAWMLFMTFIPFFVVKTFHDHGSEPQPVEFHCILTLVPYETITYQDKVVCKRTYSHHLRAPPAA